jgi:hypothetical protein
MAQLRTYAGDSFVWRAPALVGYLPADGWVLKARLVARVSNTFAMTYSGTEEAGRHVLLITPAQTALWSPTAYSLVPWLERSPDVCTLDAVQLDVRPDPRTASGGLDTRSLAERTLADLKAAFAEWSSTRGVQRKYRVNEREMEFSAPDQILTLIAYWEAEVAKEAEAARRAAGGKPRNKIKVRFTRAR